MLNCSNKLYEQALKPFYKLCYTKVKCETIKVKSATDFAASGNCYNTVETHFKKDSWETSGIDFSPGNIQMFVTFSSA